MLNKETVGKRILLQRKRAGLNQTQLAKLIHVGKSTISIWENDDAEPKLSQLKDLASALDCTVNYLIGIPKGEIKILKSENEFSQSIEYRKHTHEWNVIRNLMLAFSVASGITTIVVDSNNWYIISLISIFVYIVCTLLIGLIDTKNSKSKINYPLGEKLLFMHKRTENEIKKIKKDHITTVAFQFFLILLSLFSLIGITYEEIETNEGVYLFLLFAVIVGWTIFMFVEGFSRAYIGVEVQYDKVRKNFGLGIFEMNLTLSLVWFITNLMFFYTYINGDIEFSMLMLSIGAPSLYLVLAWTIQYGQSKFYSGFTLYSYNEKKSRYRNLEEVE